MFLCDSKLNIFVSGRHLGLWDKMTDIFHHLQTFYRLDNYFIIQDTNQQIKYSLEYNNSTFYKKKKKMY